MIQYRNLMRPAPGLICAMLLLHVGCGGSREDLGQVSGTVTLDGEPIADAMVQFIPQGGGGSTSYGRTDEEGHYSMMFSREAAGASIGESLVKISTADVVERDGEEVRIPELVPASFNSQSDYKVTVNPGDNEIDIPIVTDGAEIEQPEVLEDE